MKSIHPELKRRSILSSASLLACHFFCLLPRFPAFPRASFARTRGFLRAAGKSSLDRLPGRDENKQGGMDCIRRIWGPSALPYEQAIQADLFPHLEQKNDPIAQCDVLFIAAGTAIHSDSLAGCLRPFITYYRMTYDRIPKAA